LTGSFSKGTRQSVIDAPMTGLGRNRTTRKQKFARCEWLL
jgi:hypothetical protein